MTRSCFIFLSQIMSTFTGPRRKSLFPKAARPASPCATYRYHAILAWEYRLILPSFGVDVEFFLKLHDKLNDIKGITAES